MRPYHRLADGGLRRTKVVVDDLPEFGVGIDRGARERLGREFGGEVVVLENHRATLAVHRGKALIDPLQVGQPAQDWKDVPREGELWRDCDPAALDIHVV